MDNDRVEFVQKIKYESVKRLIVSRRSLGELLAPEEIKEITKTVTHLDSQLLVMAQSPMEYQIHASELARRRVILDNLKKQLDMLPKVDSVTKSSSTTNNNKSGAKETFIASSDKGLVQRQKEIMRLQDEMILEIGDGVDRLHKQALDIGDEAKMHIRLLDDLDNNVGATTDALKVETSHAEKIKEQSRICYLYICVAVEVIIIVLLLIVAFH